jgi:hypothetical protein
MTAPNSILRACGEAITKDPKRFRGTCGSLERSLCLLCAAVDKHGKSPFLMNY